MKYPVGVIRNIDTLIYVNNLFCCEASQDKLFRIKLINYKVNRLYILLQQELFSQVEKLHRISNFHQNGT